MLAFAASRLLTAILVILGASAITWTSFRLLRPELTDDGRPIPVALADFLWGLLHLDLGRSPAFGNRPVRDVLVGGLPADLSLLGGALVLGVVLGVAGGALCGLRPRHPLSRAIEGLAVLALCAPVYWVGLVAILLFSDDIGRVPVPVFGGQGTYLGLSESPARWLEGLLLPWLVLALPIAGAVLRMLRAAMGDVLGEDYVRTALGKGVPWRRVVRRHVVPAAAPTSLALGGVLSATLVGNAVLIERTFNIPGTLRFLTEASGGVEGAALDLPVLQGIVIAGAVVVVLAVLASELVLAWLDPRVRR